MSAIFLLGVDRLTVVYIFSLLLFICTISIFKVMEELDAPLLYVAFSF